jgi:hypothetical protein
VATKVLNTWQPLYKVSSRMEEVVLFRKHVILGKVSRFQGNFRELLTYLEKSKNITDQRKGLFFDENRSDLVYNLADIL